MDAPQLGRRRDGLVRHPRKNIGPSDHRVVNHPITGSLPRARVGQGQTFGDAEEKPSVTVAVRDGDGNMRSGRKNARSAGRTKAKTVIHRRARAALSSCGWIAWCESAGVSVFSSQEGTETIPRAGVVFLLERR
jgi:hypothetical protein